MSQRPIKAGSNQGEIIGFYPLFEGGTIPIHAVESRHTLTGPSLNEEPQQYSHSVNLRAGQLVLMLSVTFAKG